jgi:uncharacterized protein
VTAAPAGNEPTSGESTAAAPAAQERLELADWRRRISDLYAEVRVEAASDRERAWRQWREARETLFRTHSQSPVPAATRAGFEASHWPYDPELRFEANVTSEPVRVEATATLDLGFTLALPISTGGEEQFSRIGLVEVPFRAGTRTLGVYWMAGYAGGLFLPFRDRTNGTETYGAGRYLLDTAKSADLGPGSAPASLVLDFNFAFHPSCAFDPKWSCPLAPPENRLDLRIEAGERLS